jgi:hypothetical protein
MHIQIKTSITISLYSSYSGHRSFHFPDTYKYTKIDNNTVQTVDKNIPKLTLLPKFTRDHYWEPWISDDPTIQAIQSIQRYYTYTSEPAKIIGIEAIPDKVIFNSLDPQDVVIEYIKDDLTRVSPSGSQNGVVKDSDGNTIALWKRGGYGITIIPLKKGNGTLSISGTDLGGPYGIRIPVTVSIDIGSFSVTVNGTDWVDLKGDGWLHPVSELKGQYSSYLYYEYGIHHFYDWGPFGFGRWKWSTGLTSEIDTNRYGQKQPVWYNTFTENTESSACGDLEEHPYDLNVSIHASTGITVRFTVQYGDSSPVVMSVSGASNTRNLTPPSGWITSNLKYAYGRHTTVVKSVMYKIEFSRDEGNSWTTIKTGTDVLHFQEDGNL